MFPARNLATDLPSNLDALPLTTRDLFLRFIEAPSQTLSHQSCLLCALSEIAPCSPTLLTPDPAPFIKNIDVPLGNYVCSVPSIGN